MPRSLDFFVPCRPMDRSARAAPAPSERPSVNAHHPWRTPTGSLIAEERGPSVRRVPASGRRAPTPHPHRPRKRLPVWRFWRILLVLMIAGAVAGMSAFPDVRHAAAAALPGMAPEQAFGRDRVRILLLGADLDYDEQGRRLKSGGRADTMILADMDLARNAVHLCSIPRDTEARIPGHGVRRINSAYARGGAALARQSVEDLTGLNIHHTVVVNLDAFKEAVDAIGGVDVDVEKPLRYTDKWGGLDIDIAAGPQRLDGEHAMQFVRFRHDAMADIGRARRQQAFLCAFGDAMRRPSSIVAWPGVVRAVSRHTETDLSPAQMVALGRFAKDMEGITTETLPGSFHRSGWRPDREGVRRMAERLSD